MTFKGEIQRFVFHLSLKCMQQLARPDFFLAPSTGLLVVLLQLGQLLILLLLGSASSGSRKRLHASRFFVSVLSRCSSHSSLESSATSGFKTHVHIVANQIWFCIPDMSLSYSFLYLTLSGHLHFRTAQAYPAPYSRSKREISPLHSQSSWVAYFHWLYVSPPSHSSTHASLASAPNTPVHMLLVESLMIVLLPNPVCPSSIFLTGFLQWFSSFMKHCVLALLMPHHSPVFLPWITGRTPAFLPDQCRKGSHGRKGQLKAHWALPHLLKS